MKHNQQKYIEYLMKFAERTESHIWLGGSFLYGCDSIYSDVDISVYCSAKEITELIYGYGRPIYISYTSNPLGILIVIYEDGVAVDLEIIEKIEVDHKEFFHREDVKTYSYVRNEKLCKELALRNESFYQISRLFHRSLIKFLSGKRDVGVSIVNEIVTYINLDRFIDEKCYESRFIEILKRFEEQHQISPEYYELLYKLVGEIDKAC